jgi:3-dehydroquinate dehydratase-2
LKEVVFVLNGPNLDQLGKRNKEIYGSLTVLELAEQCRAFSQKYSFDIVFRQTSFEGELIQWIHEANHGAVGLILNAGAYTHTSIALYDALEILTIPILEVHLSNLVKRESFRHQSYVSPWAKGVIMGMGSYSYLLAIQALHFLKSETSQRDERFFLE